MLKQMKPFFYHILAYMLMLCLVVCGIPVSANAQPRSGGTLSGMVRVYLSSIGSNQSVDLTIAGSYSIGGDEFQNREKKLPAKKGRTWYECDLNTVDGKRSDERLVYSSDGLIYYTPDAHDTFIQLY